MPKPIFSRFDTYNDGKIKNGWIDFRAWEKNPDGIRFKENQNDAAVYYTLMLSTL
jgi:hypothetical protein